MKKIIVMLVFVFEAGRGISFSKQLKMHFVDVGEGDAILNQVENTNILIDTGYPVSVYKLSSYIEKQNVNKLDLLLLTHPHMDHIGGYAWIMEKFHPVLAADNGELLTSHYQNDFYRWYDEKFRSKKSYRKWSAPQELIKGDFKLNLIHPAEKNMISDWNANSMVFLFSFGKFKALLAGDLNKDGEKILMKNILLPKVHVLKVGHHGAKDCCSVAFLEKLKPEIAIISINKNNFRGYPHRENIKTLKTFGAKILYTYESGNILIEAEADGSYKINTER